MELTNVKQHKIKENIFTKTFIRKTLSFCKNVCYYISTEKNYGGKGNDYRSTKRNKKQ